MKNSNYKAILKNLNRKPADQAFLASFRQELDSFVQARPIAQPGFFMLFTKSATVLGLLVFVVLSGGGLVYASQGSLPGQLLYPVKIATEEARLAITTKPESRKKLQLEFIDKRVNEVNIISKENNASRNAEKALQIINEKIKEIEKLESEDDAPIIKSPSFKNGSPKELPAIRPAATSPQSTTAKSQESDNRNEQQPDQERKNRNDDFEKSKARLKESHAILERLIRSDRQENTEKETGDRLKKELPGSATDTTTKIESSEPKIKTEDEHRSSNETIEKENDGRNPDKEKKRSDEQKKDEESGKQKDTERDSR